MQVIESKCACGRCVTVLTNDIGCYNVGEVATTSGFRPIFVDEPDFLNLWLCPECADKAEKLAIELTRLTGNPAVKLMGLLPEDEREKWLTLWYRPKKRVTKCQNSD